VEDDLTNGTTSDSEPPINTPEVQEDDLTYLEEEEPPPVEVPSLLDPKSSPFQKLLSIVEKGPDFSGYDRVSPSFLLNPLGMNPDLGEMDEADKTNSEKENLLVTNIPNSPLSDSSLSDFFGEVPDPIPPSSPSLTFSPREREKESSTVVIHKDDDDPDQATVVPQQNHTLRTTPVVVRRIAMGNGMEMTFMRLAERTT
jgi:hypothetical protein